MGYRTEALRLRIYVGESDTYGDRPLHQAILREIRRQGLAGATVIRGSGGFGKTSRLDETDPLRLSEDTAIVIECVDLEENIERALPALDWMVGDGMVTLEKVDVRVYRGGQNNR